MLAVMTAAVLTSPAFAAEQRFVSIGTGGVTGVYYPAGGAICRLVNRDRKDHGVRCSVEPTGGSVDNIEAIAEARFEFGVTQSDVQAFAYLGQAQWEGRAFDTLRTVFALHPEPVTMLARPDSGIHGLEDIKGRTVNIGNPGSGQFATWEIMEAEGLVDRKDLAKATMLRSAEVGPALCSGKIDSYFWLVGHPSEQTQETIASCDAVLVGLKGAEIDALVAKVPYYRKAVIPAGMYNNDIDVETFGTGAVLVTSADVPEDVVYTMVKAVFENFDAFREMHPVLANLREDEMVRASLAAPLHPGAMRYYRERGWR